ncbi:hypothetical protein HG530_005017 [Fusarium avenaceum]|nr:hypothetical protein HG530_005017 [Fusarium avenaceum]
MSGRQEERLPKEPSTNPSEAHAVKTDAGNLGDLLEELADAVLVDIERKVTDEESIALGADSVAVALSAIGSTVTGVGISRTSVGVVEVDGTALKLNTLHSLVGLGARGTIVEVNVTEATAAAGTLLGHDTSVGKTLDVLEGLVERVVVNAPAQATSEEGSSLIGLGLLGIGLAIILSLALLGGSLLGLLDLGTSLLIGVAAVATIGIILGIVGVGRVGLLYH